jgi:hypothetical protein
MLPRARIRFYRAFRNIVAFTLLNFLLSSQTSAQLIIPAGTRYAAQGSPNSRKFISPNGKFAVVLDQTSGVSTGPSRDCDITAAMVPADVPSAAPKWSRSYKGEGVIWIGERDIHVSDQGDYFLLVENSGLILSLYKETSKQIFDIAHPASPLLIPTGVSFRPTGFQSVWRPSSGPIFKVDELKGERIFGYWEPGESKWTAHKISDGAKIEMPAEMIKHWNEEVRRGILDKLAKTRRSVLVRKIGKLPEPIAKLTGVTNTLRLSQASVREVDLEFLTSLRNPDDRQWLEFFLNSIDRDGHPFWPSSGFLRKATAPEPEECHLLIPDRFIADRLLAIWENKLKPPKLPKPPSRPVVPLRQEFFSFGGSRSADDDPPLYFLGKISGQIHLSALFSPFARNASGIRFILLPQNSAQPAETNFFVGNHNSRAFNKTSAYSVSAIPFAFHTVIPGTYRLKVIWDKRCPFTDIDKAGPGDYESDLSAPITVAAGGQVTNLIIQCTNRVPGGEAYYAADELRVKSR